MKAQHRFPELWDLLSTQTKGMILGMEELGAIFDGIKYPFLLFRIPKESEIQDEEKLAIANRMITRITGLRIKVKKLR